MIPKVQPTLRAQSGFRFVSLVVEKALQLTWQFDFGLTLWIIVSTALVSFVLILLANRSIFSPKVYPLIRNE